MRTDFEYASDRNLDGRTMRRRQDALEQEVIQQAGAHGPTPGSRSGLPIAESAF
jgi:hypothetical protein